MPPSHRVRCTWNSFFRVQSCQNRDDLNVSQYGVEGYSASGRGILFEDEDMPFIEGDDELDSAFRIIERCRRPNKKFNSEEVIFQVLLDPDCWLNNGSATIGQTSDAIRTLFESLLRRMTSSLEPTDLIRAIIFSEHLDRDPSLRI
ncbi:uncharacterized protein TNCV_4864351 [Trichonephila clavipes]|nr:uncharacterized protein TNCV_4864351 [Trichonephila clavipes]